MALPWRLVLLSAVLLGAWAAARAGASLTRPRLKVPTDLSDVEDDEEDDAWREWGQPKVPKDVYKDGRVDFGAVQKMAAYRMKGPAWGFIRLQYDRHRTREKVVQLGHAWTGLMLTAHVKAKFFVLDTNTLYVRLEDERQIEEVVEFVLEQEDGYEVKVGDRFFRQPGDPPSTEVVGDPDLWKETDKLSERLVGTRFGPPKKPEL